MSRGGQGSWETCLKFQFIVADMSQTERRHGGASEMSVHSSFSLVCLATLTLYSCCIHSFI